MSQAKAASAFAGLLTIQAIPTLQLCLVNHRELPAAELLTLCTASGLGLSLQACAYPLYPRIATLLATALGMLALLEAWFIATFGWPFDGNALNLAVETNAAEAIDLLSSLPWHWWPALAVPVALLGLIAWRHVAAPPSNARAIARRSAFFLIGAIAAMAVLYRPDRGDDGFDFESAFDTTFRLDPRGKSLALRGAFPTGLPWVLTDFLGARRDLHYAIQRQQHFRFGADALPAHPRRRVYVFVVGETTRGDHLALNGYARDTTPRLSARGEQIISLRRMYTVSTFTRLSVPVMLSRKPPDSVAATFDEASIVTAFKESGFATTWISLQAPMGYHESPVTLHAAEADRQIFLNPADYRNSGRHDDAAIIALRRTLQMERGKDHFIVVHLLGSHFQYVDRYPERFGRFLPDRPEGRKARLFNAKDKEYLLNSYDNTILFQDMVLDGIIESLSAEPDTDSWMFYASDHGEALFDDCREYSGHGMDSLATQHVASVFWASPSYASARPEAMASLRQHAEALTSTSMLFETLADLGGLRLPRNRARNSLAGPDLRHPEEVADIEAREASACSTAAGSGRYVEEGKGGPG